MTQKNRADPIMGGSVSCDFAKSWSVIANGTIGGFGINADIAGEVFAGVNNRIKDRYSATLGYRYLHEEYDRESFSVDLDTHGLLRGFGFHF